MTKLTYSSRALLHSNPTAQNLLLLMDRKKSNLCVALDVTTQQEFFAILEKIAPYICILKTHIDILVDFTPNFIVRMKEMQREFDFLVFEDRKFADIGNTVKSQYRDGIYRICEWANITDAHSVPGDGIVQGLEEVGKEYGNALFLLAEMSSQGSLAVGTYTASTIEMAKRNKGFVVGFVGQKRMVDDPYYIYLTPGVAMDTTGDGLGQMYRTPWQVVVESECDVIIVGRGIYKQGDVVQNCIAFRDAGWNAYLSRCE